jgi:hypothetical protein
MELERWAFVSRHVPTPEQIEKAIQAGIELIPVGDRDAFGPDPFEKSGMPDVVGVVCVNPALALQAFFAGYAVGVFENVSRPGVDGKPQFSTGRFLRWYPKPDQHPPRLERLTSFPPYVDIVDEPRMI